MISIVALIVAVGGSAYAAHKLTGKDIENRSLTGKNVKRNSLGGKVIAEGKLGTVPSATQAASATAAGTAGFADSAAALEGFDFATIDATQPVQDPVTILPIFELGGMELSMECTLPSGPEILVSTETDNAEVRSSLARDDDVVGMGDTDFDVGETLTLSDSPGTIGMVDLVYRRSTGTGDQVVTATFSVDFGPGSTCHAYGHAVAEVP